MSDPCAEYKLLLERFLGGETSAEQFQAIYLHRFKNETRKLDEALFELLDSLFGDVDAFSTDTQLLAEKPEFYLDKARLQEKVRQAALRLSELSKQP